MKTSIELSAAYAERITQAKMRAEREGCEFYVAASIGVKNGLPFIIDFYITDWHDTACLCRVSANQTWEI